jgi:beta-catenin-like protein 1
MLSETTILSWLLERISAKTHDDNRGYAAEVLSIILQDNRQNRLTFGSKGGVETLLKVISVCFKSIH